MRTSRVSRETSRVVQSLSLHDPTAKPAISGAAISASDSGDDLSTPPSSPGYADNASESAAPSLLGKRKRKSTETSTTTATRLSVSETQVRRSPRKAEDANGTSKGGKPRRQPAKRSKGVDGSTAVESPANWEEVYNTTAEMRKRVLAPVDTMGCENLAEDHRSPLDRRLQTLIALMLSSQTKDTVTAAAMKNLQDNLPGGFTLKSLLDVEPTRLNDLIAKVGFHNNKTKYIKATALILRDQFSGDIPDTIKGTISLPGVGPKMAYLCMSAAWGRDEGIGVDVHVHRITNLWGWHKTSTPEQTRAELEAWLPKEKWHDINHLLVGFGQTICLPVGRRCGECALSEKKLCPSAVDRIPGKRRVKKEVVVKVESGSNVEVKSEEVKINVEGDDVGVKVVMNGAATKDDAEMQAVGGANLVADIEDIVGGLGRASH